MIAPRIYDRLIAPYTPYFCTDSHSISHRYRVKQFAANWNGPLKVLNDRGRERGKITTMDKNLTVLIKCECVCFTVFVCLKVVHRSCHAILTIWQVGGRWILRSIIIQSWVQIVITHFWRSKTNKLKDACLELGVKLLLIYLRQIFCCGFHNFLFIHFYLSLVIHLCSCNSVLWSQRVFMSWLMVHCSMYSAIDRKVGEWDKLCSA